MTSQMATPDESNMRDQISQTVYELMRIVELEHLPGSGAAWLQALGSLGDTVLKLSDAWEQYDQYQREKVEEERRHAPEFFIPF